VNVPSEVPVRFAGDGGAGRAVVGEIEQMLQRLLEHNEAGSIDLRAMPMAPEEYQWLRETLGEGEVEAQVQSLGPSRVRECGVPGVWWVTHYSEEGDIMSEFIEVAFCPEILITPVEDVAEGLQALRAGRFGRVARGTT